MKIKENKNFKDMLIKGLPNHLLTSLKCYLQICRTEILVVFKSKSQNSKRSSILHYAAARKELRSGERKIIHCFWCLLGLQKLYIFFFLRKSINLVLVSNRLNINRKIFWFLFLHVILKYTITIMSHIPIWFSFYVFYFFYKVYRGRDIQYLIGYFYRTITYIMSL